MKNKMGQKNNRGFTLVELIVVIAIMGVAMTVGGLSLRYIASARATECAESITKAIELTKTASMTMAGEQTLTLYKETDGTIWMKKSWESSAEQVGSSRISVDYAYIQSAGSPAVSTSLGSEGSPSALEISFNKGSGSVKIPSIASGNLTITIAGSKTYTITVYRLTGECTLEN